MVRTLRAAAALTAGLVRDRGSTSRRRVGRATSNRTSESTVELVTVDLIVRDRSGAPVRGLSPADFDVREDGVRQNVVVFDVQSFTDDASSPTPSGPGAAEARVIERPKGEDALVEAVAGRRLMVMLFDLSTMRPDDVLRAVAAAARYVRLETTPDGLVGIATVGAELEWLTYPTGDRTRVEAALARITAADGVAVDAPTARTLATDEAAAVGVDGDVIGTNGADPGAVRAASNDLEIFNNDLRLRAIGALAHELGRFRPKKAVLYFSGGLARSGHDNQVELRAAVNSAVRANVAIYPVDTGGLQTLTPGGDATRSSIGGVGLFSGRDVAGQVDDLARSQETLMTLAADTGGRAYLDSNDLGEAFARAQQDLSAYYLLGYRSTNSARDGRFRRVQVRVARPELRVETRVGYFADIDFAHASPGDREAQLLEQLAAEIPSTDLPVLVGAAWFRLSAEEYYVPLSIAVPGWRINAPAGARSVPLDIIGEVLDEGRRPIGRLRQTATINTGRSGTIASHVLVYYTNLRLPPGRFSIKVIVRENAAGKIGSFETPLVVPDLSTAPFQASAVVLSTDTRPAAAERRRAPLVRGVSEALPHPTRIVGRDQPLVFYAEVYDPALATGQPPRVRTGVTIYRGLTKVLETPLAAVTDVDAERRALRIAVDVPGNSLAPGLYTAQINVIDDAAKRFVFPRVVFSVR